VALPPHYEDFLGLSRREFLRLAALATAASLAGLPLSACATVPGRPIRREITTAAAQTDVNTYKTAVGKMKMLDQTNPNDPRGWTKQAMIHANACRHHNWQFFPWHRFYVYYFEQICRELTGVATFALPYWNWTLNPQIPAIFWDTNSPLYDSNRMVTPSSPPVDPIFVGPDVINGGPMTTGILQETNFITFAGQAIPLNDPLIDSHFNWNTFEGLVEETPHDHVHTYIGGDMNSAMSPLDPIFWVHHCRVDELWVEWNILRNNPNTNDQAWWGTTFTDFVDGKGNPVSIGVVFSIPMPLTNYQYDTQCPC
jgi:tyrosinase